MEKELYDYINSKLIELQAYGISYSGDEINKIYQNLLGSYKTIEEMKKKVDQLFKKALETKKKESLNEKAKKSEYSNFDSIKEVINFLSSSSIGSLIKLYGGSVPYLLTNKIPKRLIGDIDLSVSIDNMDKVREFISKNSDKIKVVIDTTDYDDWSLDGDLLVYDKTIDHSIELSSMGIRVDERTLVSQLRKADCLDRLKLPYHQKIEKGELPYTIGGGIGISRVLMLLLEKPHIAYVQAYS